MKRRLFVSRDAGAIAVGADHVAIALADAAKRAELDIEIVRNYDERLPRVQSDPLLLHQVFLNMVMNAEHAIATVGTAGRIEITTRTTEAGDRIMRVNGRVVKKGMKRSSTLMPRKSHATKFATAS